MQSRRSGEQQPRIRYSPTFANTAWTSQHSPDPLRLRPRRPQIAVLPIRACMARGQWGVFRVLSECHRGCGTPTDVTRRDIPRFGVRTVFNTAPPALERTGGFCISTVRRASSSHPVNSSRRDKAGNGSSPTLREPTHMTLHTPLRKLQLRPTIRTSPNKALRDLLVNGGKGQLLPRH